jgi:hypothetical protein
MSTAGMATGLGWPGDSPPDLGDVSRETSTGQSTGLGWPEVASPPPPTVPFVSVSRETSDLDAS